MRVPLLGFGEVGQILAEDLRSLGRRRADEMREAAVTVREAGIDALMSPATALRQDLNASIKVDPETPGLESMLDAMLQSTGESRC